MNEHSKSKETAANNVVDNDAVAMVARQAAQKTARAVIQRAKEVAQQVKDTAISATMHPQQCFHEERWKTLSNISHQLNDIHSRLFLGNGTPALVTRIDRSERILIFLMWIVGIIATTILTAIIATIFDHFKR